MREEIRGNVIFGNTGNGIYNCSGQIRDNEIKENSGGVISCNALIENNKITLNVGDGVSGGSNTLLGNIITENEGYGVNAFAGTVKNNVIAGNRGDGVYSSSEVINNTIVENLGNGMSNCGGTVKNNIIAYNEGTGIYGASNNSYNCFWLNTAGNFFDNYAKAGDIYAEPLFAGKGSWNGEDWTVGDYYLKSEFGRWAESSSSWTADSSTSPCIDAGDPADGIIYEPNPNGGVINIGAFGGTQYASKSSTSGPDPNDPPVEPPVCVDPPEHDTNGDCKVNLLDFINICSQWLDCGYADPKDCAL